MTGRTYITENSRYQVERIDPQGREVLMFPGRTHSHPYAIVGYADPEKIKSFMMGSDRFWTDPETHEAITSEEGLLERLDSKPRPGLKIFARLTDEEGNFLGDSEEALSQLVTSEIKEIEEAA